MKTLKEQWGSEVKFTQHLATDLDSLNKINQLVGLPRVTKAVNELSIPGGSIDVVGYTDKGHVIIYEHQDQSGRADQTHVGKTSHYARILKSQGKQVLGAILLCDSIDQIFLDTFADIRWAYDRRPSYMGHCNVHAVKSQWADNGDYEPKLFEDIDVIQKEEREIDHYRDFVNIYAKDWIIQREERNGDAITLWHRMSELDSRYMLWVHTLKRSIKVGIHCLTGANEDDEQFLNSVKPEGFDYRRSQGRATLEKIFPVDTDLETLADATETLKRSIRKKVDQKINF